MRIEWSPIKLDPDGRDEESPRKQIDKIWKDVGVEDEQMKIYYGDTFESMDKLEQAHRLLLLPFLKDCASHYWCNESPEVLYTIHKYLSGTFIIRRTDESIS